MIFILISKYLVKNVIMYQIFSHQLVINVVIARQRLVLIKQIICPIIKKKLRGHLVIHGCFQNYSCK